MKRKPKYHKETWCTEKGQPAYVFFELDSENCIVVVFGDMFSENSIKSFRSSLINIIKMNWTKEK